MSYKYHLHAYTRACAVALSTLCILHACTGGNVDKLSLQQKRKKGVTISETAIPIPLLSDAFASVSLEAGGLLGGMEGGSGQEEVESSAQGTSAGTAVARAQVDVKRQAALASTYTYTTHYSPEAAKRYGFDSVKRIPGDGNCLFRAIADQLDHVLKLSCPAQSHQVLRRIAANHMASHAQLYRAFTAEQTPAAVEKLIREMETNGVWGGQEALSALSRALQVTIVVISHNQAQAPTVHRPAHSIGTIYLYYKDRLHYDSPQVTAGSEPTEALATIICNTTIDEAYTPSSSSADTRQATKHLLQSTAAALQTEIQTGKPTHTEAPGEVYEILLRSYLGKDKSVGKLLCEAHNAGYREELEALIVAIFTIFTNVHGEKMTSDAMQRVVDITKKASQLSIEALEKLLLWIAMLPPNPEQDRNRAIVTEGCHQIMQNMPEKLQAEALCTLGMVWSMCCKSAKVLRNSIEDIVRKAPSWLTTKAQEAAKENPSLRQIIDVMLRSAVNEEGDARVQPSTKAEPGDAELKRCRVAAQQQPSAEDMCAEFKKKIAAWQGLKDDKEKKDKLLEIVSLLAAPDVPLACIRAAIQAKVPDTLLEILHKERLAHKKIPPALCNCLKGTPACAGAIFESFDLLIEKGKGIVDHEIYQRATEALVQGVLNNPSRTTSDEQCVNGVIAALQASYQKPINATEKSLSILKALVKLASVKLCQPALILSMLQKTFEVEKLRIDNEIHRKFFIKYAAFFNKNGWREDIFKLLMAFRDEPLISSAKLAVSANSREEAIPLLVAYKPEDPVDKKRHARAWSILMAELPEDACLEPYIKAGAFELLLQACKDNSLVSGDNTRHHSQLIFTLGDMCKKLSPKRRNKVFNLLLEKIKDSGLASDTAGAAIKQALSKVFQCSDEARRNEILSALQAQAERLKTAPSTEEVHKAKIRNTIIVHTLKEWQQTCPNEQILRLLSKFCTDEEELGHTRQMAAEAILSHKSILDYAAAANFSQNSQSTRRKIIREESSANTEQTEDNVVPESNIREYFESAFRTLQVVLNSPNMQDYTNPSLPARYRAAETLISFADVACNHEVTKLVLCALHKASKADDFLVKLNANHFLGQLAAMLQRKQLMKSFREAAREQGE